MTNTFDHEEIVRLTKAGRSAPQIAAALGCSSRTVLRARREGNVSQPDVEFACAPVTPERLEAARRLLEDGASPSDVENTIHMSSRTIRKHFPGSGWTPAQSVQHARQVRRLNEIEDVYKRNRQKNLRSAA